MSKFLNEFKEFALRGNVLDLAVGVFIGGAFQGVVNSLVQDIISHIIGLFANQDFSNLVLTLGGVQIKYGSFITALINFIIMAFVIFLIVKSMNKLASLGKHQEVAVEEEPTTKVCPYCCSEIPISATRCPNCTSELN